MMINWQADEAIATIVSSVAIVAGAIFVVIQLRQAARDRYFTITANLFEIWQSSQFQDDQLFLLHKLNAVSWDEFVANGRGERAERALHRVAGFYDRVGNLIRNGLIREDDILPTLGGFAIAVWQRIEPIVQEARRRENRISRRCCRIAASATCPRRLTSRRPRHARGTSNESGRMKQSAWSIRMPWSCWTSASNRKGRRSKARYAPIPTI